MIKFRGGSMFRVSMWAHSENIFFGNSQVYVLSKTSEQSLLQLISTTFPIDASSTEQCETLTHLSEKLMSI